MAAIILEIPNERWKKAKQAMNGLLSQLGNSTNKSIRDDISSINEIIFGQHSLSNRINKLTTDELSDMMDEIQQEMKQSDSPTFTNISVK